MNDVSPIGRVPATPVDRQVRPAAQSPDTAVSSRPSDRVEVSLAAQMLSKLAELPDIRQDLVDRIRAEIAAGTYETPEKLDAALDELIQDLD